MRRFSGLGVECGENVRENGGPGGPSLTEKAATGEGGGLSRTRTTRGGLRGLAVGDAVAELFHFVMGDLHLVILAVEEFAGGQVEVLVVEGLLVGGDRGVLAAFAFGEDGVRLVGGEGGLEVDPAAMHGAGDAAGLLDVGAEGEDAGLQFGDEFAALDRVAVEQLGKFGGLDVLGGGLETVLAVAKGLDEVVEGLDGALDVGVHDEVGLEGEGGRRPAGMTGGFFPHVDSTSRNA